MSTPINSTILTPDILKLRVASQLAPAPWRRELERVCQHLESNHPWSTIPLEAQRGSPQKLAALVRAGEAAGHPADITLAVIQRRHLARMAWRDMIAALLYPSLLLAIALVVTSLVGLVFLSIIGPSWSSVEEFQNLVTDFFDAILGMLVILAWLVLTAVTIYFLASPSAFLRVITGLPLIGRPFRWMALADLLSRLSIFTRYQPELGRAVRLTAASYGADALSPIAIYVADSLERGQSIQAALHSTVLSDPQAGLALTLLASEPHKFPDSMQRASELLEEMTRQSCQRIKLVYPPFILMVVASVVWGAWASYIELFRLLVSSFM